MPRTLGARFANVVGPPDLAAVLARRRITAGMRHRRRDATRRGQNHLVQLRHRLTGGMVMYFRRPLRRRLELRRRIHLKEDKQSTLRIFFPFNKLLNA